MSAALDAILRNAVESGAVPNVVGIAANRGGLIYSGAAGPRKVGESGEVGVDTPYWIASMTKMVTTVAALQLREQGKLDFDAPVATYLPEWDKLQVLDGFDGDTPRLRAPRTTATVANLVTHTSGATYFFWNADTVRYEELTGQPNVISGLLAALQAPLVADPGSRFEYGTNTDFLGRIVEEVSGQSLDAYFAEHILGPLGMTDSGFAVREDQRARMVALHVPTGPGEWVATGFALPAEPEVPGRRACPGLHPAGLPPLPADAVARRAVRRRPHPVRGQRGRRLRQPHRGPGRPRGDPDRFPRAQRGLRRRAEPQVGLGFADQYAGSAGYARGR
jgi:CubicO group peptidase (beta-lactamase class C family)